MEKQCWAPKCWKCQKLTENKKQMLPREGKYFKYHPMYHLLSWIEYHNSCEKLLNLVIGAAVNQTLLNSWMCLEKSLNLSWWNVVVVVPGKQHSAGVKPSTHTHVLQSIQRLLDQLLQPVGVEELACLGEVANVPGMPVAIGIKILRRLDSNSWSWEMVSLGRSLLPPRAGTVYQWKCFQPGRNWFLNVFFFFSKLFFSRTLP